MRLYYETVSTPLLSILRKLMSSEVFKDFKLVGGTAMGIVSLKPLSYWELKMLDLIEEVKAVNEVESKH